MNVIFSIILMIILWIDLQNYCVIKIIEILSIFSLSLEKKIIDQYQNYHDGSSEGHPPSKPFSKLSKRIDKTMILEHSFPKEAL